MGRKPKVTGPERIERQQRIAAILSMRLAGFSLRAIGEAQTPPVSMQAIQATIKRALDEMVFEAVDEIRPLKPLRLTEFLVGLYERAINSDVPTVDRALAIAVRRARLMALDAQTSSDGPVEE
jgi:hypothetical protein